MFNTIDFEVQKSENINFSETHSTRRKGNSLTGRMPDKIKSLHLLAEDTSKWGTDKSP